jgi:hypothetical protein
VEQRARAATQPLTYSFRGEIESWGGLARRGLFCPDTLLPRSGGRSCWLPVLLRRVRGAASNVAHVHLDALVKIDESWERRRIDGPLFQFCRGVRQTFDDYYELSDMFYSEVKTTHNVETQEWIVTESEEYEQPGLPPVDRARVTFRGQTSMHTEIVATSSTCTETTLNVESGGGTHQEIFHFSSYDGTGSFSPIEQYPGFDADNLYRAFRRHGSSHPPGDGRTRATHDPRRRSRVGS